MGASHKSLFVTNYFAKFCIKMRPHFSRAAALSGITFSKLIQGFNSLAAAKMLEFLAFPPPLVIAEIHRSKM